MDAMPDINVRCVQDFKCMGRMARSGGGVLGGPRHVLFRYVGVAGAGQGVWWHRGSVGVRSEERIVGAGHMTMIVQRNKTVEREGKGPPSPNFLTTYTAFGSVF